MVKFVKRLVDNNERQLKQARTIVEKVNALEAEVEKLSFKEIQADINAHREEIKKLVEKIPARDRSSLKRVEREKGLPKQEEEIRQKLLEFMPQMYAYIRETYKREMGIRHFDVQILAGAVLAEGQKLAELKTGEGKTMVFNLPAFLYALAGRGVHAVTVNEYLAKRDAEYAGHIASKLGLTIGVVAPNGVSYKFITDEQVKEYKGEDVYKELKALGKPRLANMKGLNLIECTKHDAYACDVVFSVNSELGFDYLRDNMARDINSMVQRELYFCIVDEADSILIDEARTPLIISATPSDSDVLKYEKFAKIVSTFEEDKDYTVEHKQGKSVLLTEDGLKKAEDMLGIDNLWADHNSVHHLENAVKAKALFLRDDDYMVRGDEVLIVDKFTGRVMPGRRYSEGIHQAIEAKEQVTVQQESQTFATITFQNFFRLYKILGGGSGTILTEGEEFYKVYTLESIVVPPNKPVVREDKADLIFRNQDAKFKALVKEVQEWHEKGRPVLIGTTSIEKSELISGLLDELGVPHNVLNAKYHEREAHIVARAGEKGAITVATNMAGRGTDIPLGEGVRELGGLVVIGSERHEARRIDNQLRGRSGRQGDPGYTRFYVALDDTIMKILGGDILSKSVGRIMEDDLPIELGLITRQIEMAQKRVESLNFDTRKDLVEYDDVMNQHREVFYSRRRRLMILTENALGHFTNEQLTEAVDGQVAATKEGAVAEIREIVERSFDDELEVIANKFFTTQRKLNEESLQDLVNEILDLAPDTLLAKVFDVKLKDLRLHLLNSLRGLDRLQTIAEIKPNLHRALEIKFAEFADELPLVAKFLVLETMDNQWMEHLETMTDVRSGIGLQGLAQRDPLVEYKNVAYQLFSEMIQRIDSQVARSVLKVTKVQQPPTQMVPLQTNENQIEDILTGDREMLPEDGADSAKGVKLDKLIKKGSKRSGELKRQTVGSQGTIRNIAQQVGRNDLCPCGSGLKYKKCGLINSPEHQKHMAGK